MNTFADGHSTDTNFHFQQCGKPQHKTMHNKKFWQQITDDLLKFSSVLDS